MSKKPVSDVQPDCTRCGACCVSTWDSPTYVNLTDEDRSRLEAHLAASTVRKYVGFEDEPRNDYLSLTTKENRQGHVVCVALRGSVGGRCSCSIYEIRPKACRDFRQGSVSCVEAREEAGLA